MSKEMVMIVLQVKPNVAVEKVIEGSSKSNFRGAQTIPKAADVQ
jgi:hypothetical protein